MFVRIIWIALAVVVLATGLINFDRESNPDIAIFLFYGMVVLSFPAGLILAAILSYGTIALHSHFGIEVASSYASISAMWFAFLVVGYWQWFVLVPHLRSWLKKPNQTSDGRR